MPSEQVIIFVSYSHEDERWLDPRAGRKLIPFLADSLRKQNVLFWYDRTGISAGDEFRRRIEAEIDRAHIAILLISQGFLNSRFIEEVEFPRIKHRAESSKL